MDNMVDNTKPALVWATLTAAGIIHEQINIIGGIISIGYTLYKIIKDFKRKKDEQ